MIEVLKQMYQLLLTEPHAPAVCDQLEVILRQAIKELESQEPAATLAVREHAPVGKVAYVLEVNLPVGIHKLYTHPPQRTEQNFCPRCGKRTNDIHTCTPPREKNT